MNMNNKNVGARCQNKHFLEGKHANKCIGTLLGSCDGHRDEEPERTVRDKVGFLLCKSCWGKNIYIFSCSSIMYWFTISGQARTCLSFLTTRLINLMCSGLRSTKKNNKKQDAWKLSRFHDILCCRLLFYFVTSTKDTTFQTVVKKVSFGQPARQKKNKENKNKTDKIKLSQHTGKPFQTKRLLFSGCIYPAA